MANGSGTRYVPTQKALDDPEYLRALVGPEAEIADGRGELSDLVLRALNPDGSVRDAQAYDQLLRAGR